MFSLASRLAQAMTVAHVRRSRYSRIKVAYMEVPF